MIRDLQQCCKQVHELTRNLVETQMQALCTAHLPSSPLMRAQQTLTLCLFCTYFNVEGLFRLDCRSQEYSCARCNLRGTVVQINLLGRLLYIDRVPLVLSPESGQVFFCLVCDFAALFLACWYTKPWHRFTYNSLTILNLIVLI